MTTFQNFRKSRHSIKSNKSNSRISNGSQLFDMGNIHFSTNEVVFRYEQSSDVLISYGLTISNFSQQSIYYRVVSNSSAYYEIAPWQDILHSSARSEIAFKLKKGMMTINPRDSYTNNLEKIKDLTSHHLFYVQWAPIAEEQIRNNQLPELSSQQILTIRVVEPYSQIELPQPIKNGFKKAESISIFQDERLLSKRKSSRVAVEPLSNRILQSQQTSVESGGSLLTTPIIATVAILSFLIGFISA